MSKSKPFKILFWGDYNAATGFATVSTNILKRLRKYFGERMSLDIIAVNYVINNEKGEGVPGKQYFEDNGFTNVVPAINEDFVVDELGRHEFLRYLYNHDYDGVFIIQDPGVLAGKKQPDGSVRGSIAEEIKKVKEFKKQNNKKQFKTIYYYPIDGVPMPYWFDDFDVFDVPVAYTQYAKAETVKIRPDLAKSIKEIYHGVDTKIFKPLPPEEKADFKKEYFGENAEKFIICNVNRNQSRKDIPTTILAFADYKKYFNENSFLYLHMNPVDPMGWNLYTVMAQTGLREGVDYMYQKMESRDITPADLNKIYNACDLFVNTTSGEGFGLTFLESMAAGLPSIIPEHTSLIEISGRGDRAYMITEDYLRPYVSRFDNMVRQTVDHDTVVDAICMLQENESIRAGYINKGCLYAQSLSWDRVCKKWIDIFEQLF